MGTGTRYPDLGLVLWIKILITRTWLKIGNNKIYTTKPTDLINLYVDYLSNNL